MSQYVKPARLQAFKPMRDDTDHLPLLKFEDLPNNIFWRVLGQALLLCRDHESLTESYFVAWLAKLVPFNLIDAAGNLHVDLRTESHHRTLFTSHTDTVHIGGGPNKVRVDGHIWRADKDSPLGADDGAGLAIMCHMIEANVPGYYIFFRGEEVGGVGSSWLAKNMPKALKNIDRAIAFDRADFCDVITHQRGGRCCSDEFAEALALQLTTETAWYLPCNGGVYTDTAELTGLVAECTNISVGYKHQHGDQEQLDTAFAWALAQKCATIDWDALPVKRKPGEDDFVTPRSYYPGAVTAWSGKSYFSDGYDDSNEEADTYAIAENELMTLLTQAEDSGDFRKLIDVIAFAAYPENPATAKNLINQSAICDHFFDSAYDMIENGWEADEILLELFNYLT